MNPEDDKCPFLYDSCMCAIPEEGEHCPEAFNFPDGKGGRQQCSYTCEQRATAKAVMEHGGRYRSSLREAHTTNLLSDDVTVVEVWEHTFTWEEVRERTCRDVIARDPILVSLPPQGVELNQYKR
jgi:hypothetical protein